MVKLVNELSNVPDVHNDKPRYKVDVEEVGLNGFKLKPLRFGNVWLIPELSVSVNLPGSFRGIHLSRITKILNETFSGSVVFDQNVFEPLCRKIASTHEYIEKVKLMFRSKVMGGGSWVRLDLLTSFNGDAVTLRVYSLSFITINACPCSLAVSQYVYGKPYSHLQKSKIKVDVKTLQQIDLLEVVKAVNSILIEPRVILDRIDESKMLAQIYSEPRFNEDLTREVLHVVFKTIEGSLKSSDKIRVSTVSYETLHTYRVFSNAEYEARDLKKML